jgi:hypothetical protein
LFVYPVRGKIYPFPFSVSPDSGQDAAALVRDTLTTHPRFIIYGPGPNALAWADWFSKRPELAGWRSTTINDEAIGIFVFENPAPHSSR